MNYGLYEITTLYAWMISFVSECNPDRCLRCSDPDTCTKCEVGTYIDTDDECAGNDSRHDISRQWEVLTTLIYFILYSKKHSRSETLTTDFCWKNNFK